MQSDEQPTEAPDSEDPHPVFDREWRPAFARPSWKMSDYLARIHAALTLTTTFPLLPAQEDELRHSATVGTVHYSTLIEGNELSVFEAELATRRSLDPDSRPKIELINYVDTLDWLDRKHEAGAIEYSEQFLLEMQRRLTRGLGRDGDDHFKPYHEGAYRDGVAVVFDHATNEVLHEGRPPSEVPERMQLMFDYLNSRRENKVEYPGAILAGLAHHYITDVHPFADGNGRTARTFAVAVLMREGYLPVRIFSFERHYAEDHAGYFAALRTVKRTLTNYTEWLEYFLDGLTHEYEAIAARVVAINEATGAARTHTHLSATQEQIITRLAADLASAKQLAEALDKSSRWINKEMKGLIELGVVRRHRIGRGQVVYQLIGSERGTANAGRPREWTREKISAELSQVIVELGHFPSMKELRDANSALFSAVRRDGGMRVWKRRLPVTSAGQPPSSGGR